MSCDSHLLWHPFGVRNRMSSRPRINRQLLLLHGGRIAFCFCLSYFRLFFPIILYANISERRRGEEVSLGDAGWRPKKPSILNALKTLTHAHTHTYIHNKIKAIKEKNRTIKCRTPSSTPPPQDLLGGRLLVVGDRNPWRSRGSG
jgi:hypothetical protein